MALRRAFLVVVLALTFVPMLFGSSFGACHAAGRRAAAAPALEEMPCHQSAGAADERASSRRVSVRAADCCAAHPACGLCNGSGFTPAWPVAVGRQAGCSAQRAASPPIPVIGGGRALDHIPLA